MQFRRYLNSRRRRSFLVGCLQLAAIGGGSAILINLPNSVLVPAIFVVMIITGWWVLRGRS